MWHVRIRDLNTFAVLIILSQKKRILYAHPFMRYNLFGPCMEFISHNQPDEEHHANNQQAQSEARDPIPQTYATREYFPVANTAYLPLYVPKKPHISYARYERPLHPFADVVRMPFNKLKLF